MTVLQSFFKKNPVNSMEYSLMMRDNLQENHWEDIWQRLESFWVVYWYLVGRGWDAAERLSDAQDNPKCQSRPDGETFP